MDNNIVLMGFYTNHLISAEIFFMVFLLFRGVFDMSLQDLQFDQTIQSNFIKASPDELREQILKEDKKKRQRLFLFSCLIIALFMALITLSILNTNIIQDPQLVNNVDLLLSSEEISFYKKMEFYQWLNLAVAEQAQ